MSSDSIQSPKKVSPSSLNHLFEVPTHQRILKEGMAVHEMKSFFLSNLPADIVYKLPACLVNQVSGRANQFYWANDGPSLGPIAAHLLQHLSHIGLGWLSNLIKITYSSTSVNVFWFSPSHVLLKHGWLVLNISGNSVITQGHRSCRWQFSNPPPLSFWL